jgi:hypothetical protein
MNYLPNTSDWNGRWKLAANASNDFMIDREMQRTTNFTGFGNIHLQDQAITESMGGIYQRDREHLGTSDSMIIRTRRRLINAARMLREQGVEPQLANDPSMFRIRSGGVVIPRNADWLEATKQLRTVDREIEEAIEATAAAGV